MTAAKNCQISTCILSTSAPTIKRSTVWLSESFEYDPSQEQQATAAQKLQQTKSENEGVHCDKFNSGRCGLRTGGCPARTLRVLREGFHLVCSINGTQLDYSDLPHNN